MSARRRPRLAGEAVAYVLVLFTVGFLVAFLLWPATP